MNETTLAKIHLQPENNKRLASLCGQFNEHLQQVEKHYDVAINHRGHHFQISGDANNVESAQIVINKLYDETIHNDVLTPNKVHLMLQGNQDLIMQKNNENNQDHKHNKASKQTQDVIAKELQLKTRNGLIKPYTENQKQYIQNIYKHDINFCVGPAGTGKTYLAVAYAVEALITEQVQRILLVRPALEAGEKLGFLPGDLADKVDPYLRPLYDALFEMLGSDLVSKYLEQGIIEIAPLAYMRGRTLNDSLVILDESQNTTIEQMKMFLTRIGFGSKAIVTGDITQTDLPQEKKSGLLDAINILQDVEGICFTTFESKDVVRHSIVQRIIEAYDNYHHNNDANNHKNNGTKQN